MACSINATTWNSDAVLEGTIIVEDSSYLLRLNLDDGSVQDLPLDVGVPQALQVNDGSPPQLEHVQAGWKKKCKPSTTIFELDPRHTAGNFTFRKDGTGIGVSDIRDDGFRVLNINLNGFPVTLERIDDKVLLRFQNETSNYFISPKFTT